MRKILLAGAALGALTLTDAPAFAQRVDSPQPYAPSAGGPSLRTEPGVQVRLAGRYRFYMGYIDQDFDSIPGQASTSSVDFMDYARLWPGFDAMAANGLQYGAQMEIRMNDPSTSRGSNRGNLSYRRMYGYVATPTMGEFRVGSGQTGAVERMFTGHIMGSITNGLWDSGDMASNLPINRTAGSLAPSSFWYSSSTNNNQTKIGYYTPRFFGFDFGVSYAPNDGNFGGDGGCNLDASAGANCDRLSASSSTSQTIRVRNIMEVMGRYRGTLGPVALTVSGGWYGADTVAALGGAQAYQNISMGIFGAQASVAGFTFGGIVSGGQGNYARPSTYITPTGPVASRNYSNLVPLAAGGYDSNMFTWQVGVSYTVGPYSVGVAYAQNSFEGSQLVSSTARDQALGVGASYAVAPGLNLFAEYMYGRRVERGVDLTRGIASNENNAADMNIFTLGTSFNW